MVTVKKKESEKMTKNYNEKIYRITEKQVAGSIEWHCNVTFYNESGKRCNKAVLMTVKELIEKYDDTSEHNTKVITDFMRSFIVKKMFTRNHRGKMAGKWSLSTSPLMNTRCMERHLNHIGICAECFSQKQLKIQKNSTGIKLARNTMLLTAILFKSEWVKNIIPLKDFRIESFADLNNTIQCINYLTLINGNINTVFGWWSKNFDILEKVMDCKPNNCNFIYSALKINESFTSQTTPFKRYWFIDKVFTVWKNEKIAYAHGKNINCGAKDCNKCNICYTKNNIKWVNELLK